MYSLMPENLSINSIQYINKNYVACVAMLGSISISMWETPVAYFERGLF